MISMAIILGVFSAFIELVIASKSKVWHRAITQGIHAGPIQIERALTALILSIGLSFTLGTLFGAHGLISFTAGAFSTGIVLVAYPIINFCEDNQISPASIRGRLDSSVARGRAFHSQAHEVWEDFRQPLADFGKLMLVVLRFITLPVRILRAGAQWYNRRVGVRVNISTRS